MRIGNWPLVMLALEHIIKHADQYRQTDWRSDCGTFRCFAGWIAFFAGWRDVLGETKYSGGREFYGVNRTGRLEDGDIIPISHAALRSLELDPAIYGDVFDAESRSWEMEHLVIDLFEGGLYLREILTAVKDLMDADGVTPTPLIRAEMVRRGVLSEA